MDVRIINKNGDMFAVGERTIKVYGNTLILFDQKTNTVEYVEDYHTGEIAEGIKNWIISGIKFQPKDTANNIVFDLSNVNKQGEIIFDTKESD